METQTPAVNDSFLNLIPIPLPEELDNLKKSILTEGCRDPLVVWAETNTLLDGHNRLSICLEHDLPYQVKLMSFADENEAKVWIILNQFSRRNLNPFQRSELALKLESIFAAQARKNQGARTHPEPIRTREAVAEVAAVSHGTLDKVKAISQEAHPSLAEAVRKGEVSIDAAYQVATAHPQGKAG